MSRFPTDNAGARKRAMNGHKKRAAGNVVMVEGVPWNLSAVADRLGVSRDSANKRLSKAQKSDGPVTWAKLEGRG